MLRLMALSAAMMSLVTIVGCDQSSGRTTNQVSAEKPPAQRISEFEDSAFCKKYHCWLDETFKSTGQKDRWFYFYRLEGNNLMFVQLSVSANGERQEPYVAVYWRPVKQAETVSSTATATTHTTINAVPEKEIAPVRDLANELVGSDEFDASTYAKKCLLSYTHDKKGINGAIAQSYAFECTYAESNDQNLPEQKMFPQLTLVISKLSLQEHR